MFKKVKLWGFFAEDMLLSIENPKNSTRKLLKVINEFSVNLQTVKSTPRNQWCFHMLKTKYHGGKKTNNNKENYLIHNITKNNKIFRDEFNQKD